MTLTSPRHRQQGTQGGTRRTAGFTLIELLIVMAIIGILASIAYPSYTRYVERSRVSDGIAALMRVAGQLERCYTENNTYAEASCIQEDSLPDSEAGVYQLSYEGTPGSTYTLRAVHSGSQVTSGCETLKINQAGTTTPSDSCW